MSSPGGVELGSLWRLILGRVKGRWCPSGSRLGYVGGCPRCREIRWTTDACSISRTRRSRPAAAGTVQDIDSKRAPHQLGPVICPGRGCPSAARVPVGLHRPMPVRGRHGLRRRDHRGPPGGARGEDAVVQNQVDARPWRQDRVPAARFLARWGGAPPSAQAALAHRMAGGLCHPPSGAAARARSIHGPEIVNFRPVL
jgi:hypothetical protein